MAPETTVLFIGVFAAAVVFAMAAAIGGSVWSQFSKGRDAAIQDVMAPKLKNVYDQIKENRDNIEALSKDFHELRGGVTPLTDEMKELKNEIKSIAPHVDTRLDAFEKKIINLFNLKGGP